MVERVYYFGCGKIGRLTFIRLRIKFRNGIFLGGNRGGRSGFTESRALMKEPTVAINIGDFLPPDVPSPE
jgi:hypothetical protein